MNELLVIFSNLYHNNNKIEKFQFKLFHIHFTIDKTIQA